MSGVSDTDAKRIIEDHRGTSVIITDFKPVELSGYDAFTPTTAYVVRLDDGTSYILKAASVPPAATISTTYVPNTLATEHALLKRLASQTDIPIPIVHAFDTSNKIVPYSYMLLAHPTGVPLSLARASRKLSARQIAMLELRTGAYLKQLHERVQNDWFGLPSQEKDELYSWQEAFTLLLEGLLEDAHGLGVELPYTDVRRYLPRAIGFFLFDDCEVPSLITFTGDEHSTFVDFDLVTGAPGGEEAEIRVTSFGSLAHALWGDPLLETMFIDPSAALVEGYGGPLILFARQKTKRLWYTLLLALIVLVQAKQQGKENHDKVQWARVTIKECVAELESAPNY